jgi:protein-S-isoprenylcysteine O-methyltransferase Ste14
MKIVIAGLLGIVVQLGLAILGLGGFDQFFSHAPLVATTVATFILTVVAFFSGGGMSTGEREDRGNRWVLGVFSLLGLFLAFFSAYTDRLDFWTIDGDTTRWTGFALFMGGSILRLWPVFVLGRRFSGFVALQRDHKLVTSSIYRYVRNPSYLGLLIGSFGWALVFRSGVGLIIAALLVIPLVPRMRAEERLLADHFGAEYEAYRARTWRLLPGIY